MGQSSCMPIKLKYANIQLLKKAARLIKSHGVNFGTECLFLVSTALQKLDEIY